MHRSKTVALALTALTALTASVLLTSCSSDADTASYNLSTDAEQFKIERQVVFYNGITNEVMLTIDGFCSVEDDGSQLEVTCKAGPNQYTKDFLGLSDNVTYFIAQKEASDVSVYHRKFIIKPENMLPEFDLEMGEQ